MKRFATRGLMSTKRSVAALALLGLVGGLVATGEPTEASAAGCDCSAAEAKVVEYTTERQKATELLTDVRVEERKLADQTLAAEDTYRDRLTEYERLLGQLTQLERDRKDAAQKVLEYEGYKADALTYTARLETVKAALAGFRTSIRGVISQLPRQFVNRRTLERILFDNAMSVFAGATLKGSVQRDNWTAARRAADSLGRELARLELTLTGLVNSVTVVLPPPLALQVRTAFGAVNLAITAFTGVTLLQLRGTFDAVDAYGGKAAYNRWKERVKELDAQIKPLEAQVEAAATALDAAATAFTTAENTLKEFRRDVVQPAVQTLREIEQLLADAEQSLADCRAGNCEPPCPTPPCNDGGPGDGGPGGPGGGASGEPHLYSFDGLAYDFQAEGEFVLTRSTTDAFEVQVRTDQWDASQTDPSRADRVSAMDAVAVRTPAGQVVRFSLGSTTLDGAPVPEATSVELTGGTLTAGQLVLEDGTEVAVRGSSFQGNPYLDVDVVLGEARIGAVVGLLGDADGDAEDDLTPAGATSALPWASIDAGAGFTSFYADFGPSWVPAATGRLLDGPPRAYRAPAGPLLITDLPADAVDAATAACVARGWTVDDALASCVYDVAVTGDVGFADPRNQPPGDGPLLLAGNVPAPDDLADVVVPLGSYGELGSFGAGDDVTRTAIVDVPAGGVAIAHVGGGRETGGFCFVVRATFVAPDGTTWERSGLDEGDGTDCGVVASPVSATAGVWRVRITAFGALAPPNLTARVAATTAATSTPTATTTAVVAPGSVAALTTTVDQDQAYAWLTDDPADCTGAGARAASVGFSSSTFGGTTYRDLSSRTTGGGCSIGGAPPFGRQPGVLLAVSNLYGTAASTVSYRPRVVAATVAAPLGQPVTVPLLTRGPYEAPQQLAFELRAGDTLRFAITCPAGGDGDVALAVVGPSTGPEDNGGRGTVAVRTAGTCPPDATFVADMDGTYTFDAVGGIGAELTLTPSLG